MKYNNEQALIEACKKKKQAAQQQIYEQYAPLFKGICLRYAHNPADAEDVMHEGFIKIFSVIKQYQYKGSFEGWLKRVMVNHAISSYKKNKKFKNFYSTDEIQLADDKTPDTDEQTIIEKAIAAKWDGAKVLEIILALPQPYGVVFNLFAVEGFSHKEIADMLEIKENTSKSIVRRARMKLQQEIEKKLNDEQ